MGLQLIICVETNKKCNSDFIYIRSTINRFYDVDNANIRITPVYLDGKGKYASGKVKKEVASLKNQYKAAAKNNSSIVIYCFDCDNYDTKTEDLRFLNEAREYCDENGFRFVWFCKDIEDVYLGKQISERRKKLGLSQEDLAEISGVSPRTINSVELGKANPSINVLNKMVKPLGFVITLSERVTHE